MLPLDLRHAPPRSPKVELNGLIFLPRMIDIARAKLPGGHVGQYQIGRGMSGLVLKRFHLSVEQFVEIVGQSQTDGEVYERVDAGDHSQLSRILERITVADVPADLRADFEAFYGADLPRDRRVVDLLEEDDARAFPKK